MVFVAVFGKITLGSCLYANLCLPVFFPLAEMLTTGLNNQVKGH